MREESLYEEIIRVQAAVRREIVEGGDLRENPCPFCGLPRCSRSDYIRCSKCGINWLPGEDLERSPIIGRYAAMMANQPKIASKK